MHEEGNGKTTRPIRVLLADDHTLFRHGLARLLASYGGRRARCLRCLAVGAVREDADSARRALLEERAKQ